MTKTFYLAIGANSPYFEPVELLHGRWWGIAEVPETDTAEIERLERRGCKPLSDEEAEELRKKKQQAAPLSPPLYAYPPSAPNTQAPPGAQIAQPAASPLSVTTEPISVEDTVAPKSIRRRSTKE